MIDTSADKVTVFCKPECSYCVKAKEFLMEHSVPFIDAVVSQAQRDALVQQTGHRTFPFIFVGHTFLGGYNELVHAHATLKLHELLKDISVILDADF